MCAEVCKPSAELHASAVVLEDLWLCETTAQRSPSLLSGREPKQSLNVANLVPHAARAAAEPRERLLTRETHLDHFAVLDGLAVLRRGAVTPITGGRKQHGVVHRME